MQLIIWTCVALIAYFAGTEFHNELVYLGLALVLSGSILFRHRANIKRIMNGTENKIWKTKAEKQAELKAKSEQN